VQRLARLDGRRSGREMPGRRTRLLVMPLAAARGGACISCHRSCQWHIMIPARLSNLKLEGAQ
jgi:hypothetical protein